MKIPIKHVNRLPHAKMGPIGNVNEESFSPASGQHSRNCLDCLSPFEDCQRSCLRVGLMQEKLCPRSCLLAGAEELGYRD